MAATTSELERLEDPELELELLSELELEPDDDEPGSGSDTLLLPLSAPDTSSRILEASLSTLDSALEIALDTAELGELGVLDTGGITEVDEPRFVRSVQPASSSATARRTAKIRVVFI
jgi:hypothetical protein